MIHFVPTVVFEFSLTVNKLSLEVDLVRALLPQVHLARLSPSRSCRGSQLSLQIASPARRAAKVDSIVALW